MSGSDWKGGPEPDPASPVPGMGAADPLERGGMPATRKRYRLRHPEREAARKRRWKQENPERNRAHSRASHLKVSYGMTVEEYEELLAAQGGVCAICKKPPEGIKRLAVDHDHETLLVRGLLCGPCNTSLGVLENHLEEAALYLETRS